MDYCTLHFGKKLNELNISDLKKFFQQERIETDQLEFKSINPKGSINEKLIGIQRSACAFLNSVGGLIIWGAPVGEKIVGKKEKIFKGELTFSNELLEKDFIISKISDSISPLPLNIRIFILTENSKCLFVMEIDPSEYSPHQTLNTYFMRIDGQTKPAPHHYIEALFKKIKYPNLEAHLKINKTGLYQQKEYTIDFTVFFFNWTPLQNEEYLSYRIFVSDGVFLNSRSFSVGNKYDNEGHELYKNNAKQIFHYGEPIYESDVIVLDPYVLEQNQNKVKIIVSFGGRFSPRKNSEYTLDFTKRNSANLNDMICEKKENMLSKDVQDEKGMNKELIIKNLLKS